VGATVSLKSTHGKEIPDAAAADSRHTKLMAFSRATHHRNSSSSSFQPISPLSMWVYI
jgi:hypothetical protein